MPCPSRPPSAFRSQVVAVCVVLVSLAGCANWPADNDAPADAGELLESSLPVAAAALAAGQLGVARRLYLSLSERFDDAPEPFLRLGYIALQNGDFAAAVGVDCGPLAPEERRRLLVDIDARGARAWNLTVDDLKVMFDDFTPDAVPPAYRADLIDRLRELG